jgi:AcrR family transcriptional regulator
MAGGRLVRAVDAVERGPPDAPLRRTRRGELRHDGLRRIAAELFLERGYDGVSVDDIVKAVGGSKTNVYSYFGNKEGLFVAVVAAMCEDFLAPLRAMDVAGLSLQDGLRALGRQLLAVLLADRHLAFQRLIIAVSGRFPQLGQAWWQHGPETSHAIIADFIESHAAVEQSAIDASQLAWLFHDMITGAPLRRALIAPPSTAAAGDADATIDAAVALVMRAVRERPFAA